MIRVIGLHCLSRGSAPALVVCAACCAVMLLVGPAVFELRIGGARMPRFVPMSELAPAVAAVCLPALLSSRMWVWEQTGDHQRLRPLAAATAIVAVVVPPALTALSAVAIWPPGSRWVDLAMNVATIAAVSILATVALGRLLGPLVGFGFYLAAMAAAQVSEQAERWGPLASGLRSERDQAVVAVGAAVVAVAAWTACLGRARWLRPTA